MAARMSLGHAIMGLTGSDAAWDTSSMAPSAVGSSIAT